MATSSIAARLICHHVSRLAPAVSCGLGNGIAKAWTKQGSLRIFTGVRSLTLRAAVFAQEGRAIDTTSQDLTTKNLILRAKLVPGQKRLVIHYANDKEAEFPYVWLRDSCQCPECCHQETRTRLIDLATFNTESRVVQVQVEDGGSSLKLHWDDGHISVFDGRWLRLRSFREKKQKKRQEFYRRHLITWGNYFLRSMPRYEFQDLFEDSKKLLECLADLEVYGITMINGAPEKPGQVRKMAELIGFIRRTHYGEVFDVKAKPGPSNVAYTSRALQLHTDLPYYKYKPGVEILHVVQQAPSGGDSQFCDGLHCAFELKKENKAHFNTLTHIPVEWVDVGIEHGVPFNKVYRSPIIVLGHGDQIVRINFSQPQRSTYFPGTLHAAEQWYEAFMEFHKITQRAENLIQTRLESGTMVMFDNLRIMHGRVELEADVNRHLEGCYIDWDEVRSRGRVLRTILEPEHASSGRWMK